MAPVGAALAQSFAAVAWQDADPPVISNVTAEPVTDGAEIRTLLARQVSAPVEWVASVRRMAGEGVDTFVECGAGAALVGMVRRIVPGARTIAVGDPGGVAEAAALLLAAEARV
jgi:[acyl-carrier-protein] S-malonyltransferase